MEAVREKWTDERLDDLSQKVDDGFRRMDERFAQVDARFDSMQRTMMNGFIALFGTQVTLFVALLGFIAIIH